VSVEVSGRGERMKVIVTWTARYRTEIEVGSDENIQDAASNIDIPEPDGTEYVKDSFEVINVETFGR
jgi:hypothetical protein